MVTPVGPYLVGSATQEEIRLSRSPLVRVLCQIRWPVFASLPADFTDIAASLGKSLSSEYPVISDEREMTVTVSPEGVMQTPGDKVLRFSKVDSSWRVSFGEGFIALETSAYQSRDDFVERLRLLLSSLADVVSVPAWSRIGYRYANRIIDQPDLEALGSYFDPAILGGHSVPIAEGNELVHSVTESVYRVGAESLLVRSAHLGPNLVLDPSLTPVAVSSWTLDLDAFEEGELREWEEQAVLEKVNRLSALAYDYFRHIVKQPFMDRFE